ncbi:WD40-repeat-containing domain protein [Cokeromyces recurvatus]|uniref:WD40-repeat-containing domain protein n=1 Tax=Cokeromyces recurvatus TaxID=90255 RepID=UPI00221ECD23|nr:WD40-repeat-containing domain protein [Cokeromyces recurvatus]KAI7902312.1 WD40-repeat-containing domain protein [Cokeromyces recurvatus]
MQISKKNSNQQKTVSNNIKNEELVRLILQALLDLGYNNAATALETESGISLESSIILKFRSSILHGEWQVAESLLSQIPFISTNNLPKVQFLIRQQKFLELLEKGETMQALYVLRTEITPLGQNTERLHLLTSLVLCSSIDDVMEQACWDGTQGASREQLLTEIQHFVDPTAMIPKQRLLYLINQSLEWQKRSCLYHNPRQDNKFSLFSDHMCDKNQFPTTTIKVLRGHTDEIWHVAYSHDGHYLASVSKDKSCIIWDMKTFEAIQTFKSEVSGSYCAWSPDNTRLLVCGTDFGIRLWDPFSGTLLHTFQSHRDQVTSCVWLPDNRHFISGACDKILCLWDADESTQPVTRWPVQRTTDMKITEDGKRFVTIGLDKCISVYDVDGLRITEIVKIPEEGTITSLTLTKDGRYALVNVQDVQELHLWDLDEREIVHKYSGQKQITYIIRSTLGGHNESFVISGSEDNHVYIWSRDHGTLLEELEGHENTVNCVSWCPIEPMQFVSASDDHTIRVWGPNQNSMMDL